MFFVFYNVVYFDIIIFLNDEISESFNYMLYYFEIEIDFVN